MHTNHHVYSVGKQRSLGMMDDMHRSRLSYRHAGTAREEETNGGAWIDAGSRLIMLLWCSTMALQWSPPSIVFALGSWVLIELAHAKPVCDAWRAMAFDPTTFTRNQTYILLLFHQFIMHRRRMSCHVPSGDSYGCNRRSFHVHVVILLINAKLGRRTVEITVAMNDSFTIFYCYWEVVARHAAFIG
jgi:hypothetical protein